MHCLPLQTVTYQGWRNALHWFFDSLRLLVDGREFQIWPYLINFNLQLFLEKVVNHEERILEFIISSVKQNPNNAHIAMAFC